MCVAAILHSRWHGMGQHTRRLFACCHLFAGTPARHALFGFKEHKVRKKKRRCMQTYYMCVTETLSQPGVACASTPAAARNAAHLVDLLDAAF